MAYVIMVAPKVGTDGVYLFFRRVRKKWLLWNDVELTPDPKEAMTYEVEDFADGVAEWVGRKTGQPSLLVTATDVERMATQRFLVIQSDKGKYYCGEVSKDKRRVYPLFHKDIRKADFMKSERFAGQALNRIRMQGGERVSVTPVYLTVENDLLIPNILFALTNKKTEKRYYLKAEPSAKLSLTESMAHAWRTDYETAVKTYETIKERHRNYLVDLHVYDGVNVPASQFKYKPTALRMDFQFRSDGKKMG